MLIDIEGPATEPLTLAQVKMHSRIETDAEDTLLTGLIATARAHVEAFTRRRLVTQTVEFRRDGLGGDLALPVAPVQSIVSIQYLDTANTLQTLASDQYRLNRGAQPVRVVPAYLVSWPSVLIDVDTVRVRMVVGYGDADAVPAPFKSAMLMLIGHWYEHREAVMTGGAAELPMAVTDLLSRHILWV